MRKHYHLCSCPTPLGGDGKYRCTVKDSGSPRWDSEAAVAAFLLKALLQNRFRNSKHHIIECLEEHP